MDLYLHFISIYLVVLGTGFLNFLGFVSIVIFYCHLKIGFAYFFKGAIPGIFSFYVFSLELTGNNEQHKSLMMTGFELRSSGVGSDRSSNYATTTAP